MHQFDEFMQKEVKTEHENDKINLSKSDATPEYKISKSKKDAIEKALKRTRTQLRSIESWNKLTFAVKAKYVQPFKEIDERLQKAKKDKRNKQAVITYNNRNNQSHKNKNIIVNDEFIITESELEQMQKHHTETILRQKRDLISERNEKLLR